MNDDDHIFVLLIAVAIGILGGFILGWRFGETIVKQEAVEQGHAQHHPQTGQWEWKVEE